MSTKENIYIHTYIHEEDRQTEWQKLDFLLYVVVSVVVVIIIKIIFVSIDKVCVSEIDPPIKHLLIYLHLLLLLLSVFYVCIYMKAYLILHACNIIYYCLYT